MSEYCSFLRTFEDAENSEMPEQMLFPPHLGQLVAESVVMKVQKKQITMCFAVIMTKPIDKLGKSHARLGESFNYFYLRKHF